jgi:hypothetical protein
VDTVALTEVQAAYLAGLIDGEGSLESQKGVQRNGRTYSYTLRLAFAFATEEPLRTISQWLDLKVVRREPQDLIRSPTWRTGVPKNKAVAVLKRALPYLILKREQAELMLAIEAIRETNSPLRAHFGKAKFQPMPDHAVDAMHALHQRLRSLKSNKRRTAVRVTLT